MLDHFSLLYVSDLAVASPTNVVAGITRQSRANNQRNDITGILVFDGECFAQLVEGSERAIHGLLKLLRSDTRHERLEVLELAPSMSPRTFPGWRLGYLKTELHESGLASLRGKQGPSATTHFARILPVLDIESGDAVPAPRTGRNG